MHWNHEGAAASIIGAIDPHAMRETEHGLQVSGTLDLDGSDTAREAWRAMKLNAMSLSFGFLATKSRKRSDGVQVLEEIDLFEISMPAPANRDTRVISMKAMDGDRDDDVPSLEELRAFEEDLGLTEDAMYRQRIADHFRNLMTDVLSPRHTNGNGKRKTQRERAEKAAQEVGAIQVTSFKC